MADTAVKPRITAIVATLAEVMRVTAKPRNAIKTRGAANREPVPAVQRINALESAGRFECHF
jgi:hypothetical protein